MIPSPSNRRELFRLLAIPSSVVGTLASAALLTAVTLSLKSGISVRYAVLGVIGTLFMLVSQRLIGELALRKTTLMSRRDISWLIIRPYENRGEPVPWEEIRNELIVFTVVAFVGVWVFQWYLITILSMEAVSAGIVYLYSIPPALFISVFSVFPSLLIWIEEVGMAQDVY